LRHEGESQALVSAISQNALQLLQFSNTSSERKENTLAIHHISGRNGNRMRKSLAIDFWELILADCIERILPWIMSMRVKHA
jgi:hypothetical protein